MKTNTLELIIFAILSLTLHSCSTKLSIGVVNHLDIAYQYQDNADWKAARDHFGKALTQAESEGAHGRYLAIINYEYGRALGVTCSFKESEYHLLKALELDDKNGGESFKDLTELARLQYDQEKYSKANIYYEKSFSALDQWDAEKKAPIAYADLLIEYSEAHQRLGNSGRAKDILNKAMAIRNRNSERHSITERTPYGKYCS